VIYTCDQYDSAFCALQLTAMMKPHWCVLLYCCACLHPNTLLMETGWTTVSCPATNWSILTFQSSARARQSEICVSLKTHLEKSLGICIYKTSFLHRPDDYIGFTPSCTPHFITKLRPWSVVVYTRPYCPSRIVYVNLHWLVVGRGGTGSGLPESTPAGFCVYLSDPDPE